MPAGLPGSKQRLREELSARRRALGPELAAEAARAVARAVVGEPRVCAAARVALYADTGGELPTRPLFEALGELGVRRLLPRVRGAELEWTEADDWSSLRPGAFGVLEPETPPAPAPAPGEWVLLPGLAFDRQGWRLGRGRGYYDRAFPPAAEAPWLVGLGYAFQCIDAVPHDSRDRRLDAIVTERGWTWRAGRG